MAKDIGDAESGKDPAKDMQPARRNPPDQQEAEVSRTVFRQVACIFKGCKTCGNGNCHHRQFSRLRLKNQIEKQQWQQFHDFFTYGCDLDSGNGAIHSILPHEEAVDIGAEQANGHTDGQKQRIAPNAPLHEKQG